MKQLFSAIAVLISLNCWAQYPTRISQQTPVINSATVTQKVLLPKTYDFSTMEFCVDRPVLN